MPVRYFSEVNSFQVPFPRKTAHWLNRVAKDEKREITQVAFIFCTDSFLLDLNQRFLRHKTLTDIITFDNSEGKNLIGEIYISIERVAENADRFGVQFEEELRRVMVHGVLHMAGYPDKSARQKAQMRKKEDAYLSLWDVPRGT